MKETANGILLSLYIQPRAPKNEICGLFNNSLKMKVNALPAKNQANQEVKRFLSRQLGLSRSQVEIRHGKKSRMKTVLLHTTHPDVKNILYQWEG